MRKQLTILLSFLLLIFAYGADSNYKIEKIVVENIQEIPEASIVSIMKEKVGDKYSAKDMIADYQKIKELDYVGKKIVVENIQEIPEASIVSIMKEKVGDKYSAKDMIADYQKIKELDYVGSVSIYPQYYNEGIKLVVDIREKRDTKELLTKNGIIPMSERDKIDKTVIVKGVEVYGNVSMKKKEDIREKRDTKELLTKNGIIPMSERDKIDKTVIVKGVEVYGNVSMKKKDILKYIPIKTGGYFSKKKVIDGYRSLGESGYFSQVVPDVQKTGNGVTVVYYVTENPTITGVNIIGNTVYPTDELLALLETKPNETLNFNSLRKDREAIIGKYSKDGYVLARVIDIGLNNSLLALLETKPNETLNFNSLRKDREAIIGKYSKDGYVLARVIDIGLNNSYELDIYLTEGVVRDIKLQKMVTKQKGKKYSKDGYVLARVIDIGLNNSYELDIYLTEGVVRDIKLQKMVTKQKGNRRQATDTLLKTKDYVIEREIEFKEGEIFNINKYTQTENNLKRLGYIKNVKYEARDILGDSEIEREIEFKEGEIFNINKYTQTENNLKRLGYIKNVKYEARDILGDSDGKDIVLLIDEDRTARLQGAISYGSELGLMGMLSLEETGAISYGSELGLMGMLSLEETNWKGKGQTTSFTYEKSDEDYSSLSLSFSDPWIKDTDRISWGWSLYKNEYENDDSEAFANIDTYGFRINVGKGITRNVRIGLGTKVEYVTTEPDDSLSDAYIKEAGYYDDKYYLWSLYPSITYDTRNSYFNPTRGVTTEPDDSLSDAYIKEAGYYDDKYYLWSLYPSITYDTRNSYFNPTRGEYARWQVEGGYASGENADYFTNTTIELRKYHQGFFKKNTFAYKAVFGIQSDTTKESQRYWIGGSSTLRGYDGGTFRGTRKFTGTIENRTEFNDVLGGVLFFDFGRAWDYDGIDRGYHRDEKMPDGIAMAAGVGLRINTPMGPLRFDFGWPINDDEESGMQFYFNMGQSF